MANKNTCDCKDCSLKGIELCEHRKYLEVISKLRIALGLTNQILGDIAGPLYDHDLHAEENAVLDVIRANTKVLVETKSEIYGK